MITLILASGDVEAIIGMRKAMVDKGWHGNKGKSLYTGRWSGSELYDLIAELRSDDLKAIIDDFEVVKREYLETNQVKTFEQLSDLVPF